MGYRNKTYVIFDGDEDMWAYGFMLSWKDNEHVEFDFYNAHGINEIRNGTQEETVKRKLRERLANTKQAVVLIGEKTKNLYRYVRWEIETCLEMGIPIVAVNLNGKRRLDDALCPPILKGTPTLHVSFKAKIIQLALDDFCENFREYRHQIDMHYNDTNYQRLGLL